MLCGGRRQQFDRADAAAMVAGARAARRSQEMLWLSTLVLGAYIIKGESLIARRRRRSCS